MKSTPKQQPNKTREKALVHARKLFAKQGFEATSMVEIARLSGIEKPSLYYFFENKECIFAEVMESVWEEASTKLNRMRDKGVKVHKSPRNYFTAILNLVLDTFLKAGMTMTKVDSLKNKGHTDFEKKYAGMFKHIGEMRLHLQEFLKSNRVKDPGLAELVIGNAIHAYVIHAQCKTPTVSPKKYAEYLSKLFIK